MRQTVSLIIFLSVVAVVLITGCVTTREVVREPSPPPQKEVVVVKEPQPMAPPMAPALRVENPGVAPSASHMWVPGQWEWDANLNNWTWVSGRWVVPPYFNAVWVTGHWEWDGRNWIWVPGRWRS